MGRFPRFELKKRTRATLEPFYFPTVSIILTSSAKNFTDKSRRHISVVKDMFNSRAHNDRDISLLLQNFCLLISTVVQNTHPVYLTILSIF